MKIKAITLFSLLFLLLPSLVEAAPHYVPLRNVFESIGSQVQIKNQHITIEREDQTIVVTPGKDSVTKNGKKVKLYKPIYFDSKKKAHLIHVLDVYKLGQKENLEKHYRVKPGDTLSEIATRFGVTTRKLKDWNSLASEQLKVGQHLHVSDPYYIVKKGDSLWEIAEKTETRIDAIKEANKLEVDFVYPGQRLYIPTQPSLQPPEMFASGYFPLLAGTYQPYGNDFDSTRTNPDGKTATLHQGIDILAPQWVPVFAVSNGVLQGKGWHNQSGWTITIEASNGIAFTYRHLNGFPEGLKIGQRVSRGQLIGYVGNTGLGPKGTKGNLDSHLHFSMFDTNLNWKPLNPFYFMKWWEMNQ